MIKEGVICHAEGPRCLGCDHYHGKAPVCSYAPAADQPAPTPMAELHPEIEREIEAGPRTAYDYKDGSEREETPKEFARRIAALAVEKERERCTRIHEFEESLIDPNEAAAIRRRGKP